MADFNQFAGIKHWDVYELGFADIDPIFQDFDVGDIFSLKNIRAMT